MTQVGIGDWLGSSSTLPSLVQILLSQSVWLASPFSKPRVEHWEAVMQILRYLKKTPGQGLLYKANNHLRMEGFADADWAGSPSDRRSTLRYYLFVDGNLISWRSKKQPLVL